MANSDPKAPKLKRFSQYAKSSCVSVFVGTAESQTKFYVHEALLKSKSEFFRAALSDGFLESAKNAIRLPEDSSGAFAYFVDWPYSDNLDFGKSDVLLNNTKSCTELVALYIFGDKLLCAGVQNAAVFYIIESCRRCSIKPCHLTMLIRSGLRDSLWMKFLLRYLACDYQEDSDIYREEKDFKELLMMDANLTVELLFRVSSRSRLKHPCKEDISQWLMTTDDVDGSETWEDDEPL